MMKLLLLKPAGPAKGRDRWLGRRIKEISRISEDNHAPHMKVYFDRIG
jgi:hypothetical protein